MYEPRYIITHGILKNVGLIEASKAVIEHAALVPAFEARFRQEALNRAVHHGTRLEGNELSFEQAEKVIESNELQAEPAAVRAGIVGRDRDVQEVINYRRVMEWISELAENSSSIVQPSEKILSDIHSMTSYRIMPLEQRGTLRTVPVVVKNSKTGEVTFRPPEPAEVPYQLEEFFEWLNSPSGKEHHPVLRAGIAHYELVRIHPFLDGNGRSARAMTMLILYLEGYDVKSFFSLEEYFDRNPREYYQALQSVGEADSYDLTYWLEYFTHGLAVELDKVKLQVLKLSKDAQLKDKIGKQVALSERQIKILETMQKQGGTAISQDLQDVLPMISVDTILRDIKDLIDKGLIVKKGKTKGAYYEMVE